MHEFSLSYKIINSRDKLLKLSDSNFWSAYSNIKRCQNITKFYAL